MVFPTTRFRFPELSVIFLILALSTLVSAANAATTITNGTISLGVNEEGNLIDSETEIGLTYVPTGGEALFPGCNCEVWGVADGASTRFGAAGEYTGDTNIIVDSFTFSGDSATSIVRINDGANLVRVIHDFHPDPSTPNLYAVDITIENISGAAIPDLRYRRAMDWDIPPTEFDELVTIVNAGSSDVLHTSDDGFAHGNPLSSNNGMLFDGTAVNSGPDDHGALFDFGFGNLENGDSKSFTIFYGA